MRHTSSVTGRCRIPTLAENVSVRTWGHFEGNAVLVVEKLPERMATALFPILMRLRTHYIYGTALRTIFSQKCTMTAEFCTRNLRILRGWYPRTSATRGGDSQTVILRSLLSTYLIHGGLKHPNVRHLETELCKRPGARLGAMQTPIFAWLVSVPTVPVLRNDHCISR